MFAPLIAFFGTKLGKVVGILLAVAAVLGLAYYAKTQYDNGIRQEQMQRDQTEQLKQLAKDNAKLTKKLDELDQTNKEILANTASKNERVVERYNEVKTYIQSPEAQKSNRESSSVIKNTIGMLRNED